MGLAINRAVAVDETASDAELVALALDGSEPAVRVLVQRHNRQLFRDVADAGIRRVRLKFAG